MTSAQSQSLMLFAAGFGTRMGALTADCPKPLIEVGGRALIDRALDLAADAGIQRVVVNTHYRAQMIADHLSGRNVAISDEQPDVLETGGGLRHALPQLGKGAVLTLNPDAVWQGPNPLTLLRAAWNPDQMDALLVMVPPQDAKAYSGTGDFHLAEDGQLTRGPGMVYAGAQILKPDVLHTIPDRAFSLNRVWDLMQGAGRLYGIAYDGRWCDVGTPEGLRLAEQMVTTGNV